MNPTRVNRGYYEDSKLNYLSECEVFKVTYGKLHLLDYSVVQTVSAFGF